MMKPTTFIQQKVPLSSCPSDGLVEPSARRAAHYKHQ